MSDTKLQNGATLIKGVIGGAVLAKFRGEFVTWRTGDNGAAYWGHYHGDDLRAAVDDFEKREAHVQNLQSLKLVAV